VKAARSRRTVAASPFDQPPVHDGVPGGRERPGEEWGIASSTTMISGM